MRNRTAAFLMMLVLLVTGFAVVPVQAYEGGGSTPEEVVERFRQAAEKGDFGGMAECLAPEDRAGMSFGLLLGTSMMTAMGGFAAEMGEGFTEAFEGEMADGEQSEASAEIAAMRKKTEELAARLEAILNKYGVTDMMADDAPMPGMGEGGDPDAAITAAFAEVDQIGLIRELGALMREIGESSGESEESSMPEGGLENLKIEGDRGTATLGDKPVEFVRIDGRWFLHQPEGESSEPEDESSEPESESSN